MNKMPSLNTAPFKILLVLLLTWLFAHSFLETIFSKLIINPILSKPLETNRVPVSVAIFILTVACLTISVRQYRKRYIPSPYIILSLFSALLLYCYYRWFAHVWIFYTVHRDIAWLNFTDLFFILIALYLVHNVILRWLPRNLPRNGIDALVGFSNDSDIVLDVSEDLHLRLPLAKNVANKLAGTNISRGSFAASIVGIWGSGKTTFMNAIRTHLSSDNYIHIDFNPWMVDKVGNITKTYFDQLSSSLSSYHGEVASDITDYVNSVINENTTSPLYGLSSFMLESVGVNQPTLTESREKISRILKEIGKKVVVYIDDVDRLDKEEITEVLRIIRNSSNFNNVMFLVAIDKRQVINAIEPIFGYGSETFLDKIFQVEVYVPPFLSDKLLEAVKSQLLKVVNDGDTKEIETIFSDSFRALSNGALGQLKHYRDISKFVNTFSLTYLLLQNEVYLPDLLIITLLHVKFPDVYSYIYRNRYEILARSESRYASKLVPDTFQLAKSKSNSEDKVQEFTISILLREGSISPNINSEDIIDIEELLKILFPESQIKFDATEKLNNSSLRIRNPSYFNRYFHMNLWKKISLFRFNDSYDKGSQSDRKSVV